MAEGLQRPGGAGDLSPQHMRKLAGQLVALRRERGLSLTEVHRLTGITRQTLGRIEREGTYVPHLDTLQRYADGLRVTLRVTIYLVDGGDG